MGQAYRARDTKLKRDVALSDKGIHLIEGEEGFEDAWKDPSARGEP